MRYFVPIANCIPIKGFRRSLIYDLQRHTLLPVPNDLYDILTIKWGSCIDAILERFPESSSQINEYFQYLLDNEFVFITEHEEEILCFPPLEKEWEYPGRIMNAVIELTDSNVNSMIELMPELQILGCRFMEVRSYCESSSSLETFFGSLRESAFRIIDLFVIGDTISTVDLEALLRNEKRIPSIFVETAENNRKSEFKEIQFVRKIQWHENASPSINDFVVNVEFFMESQFHNPYWNKRIWLTKEGLIKDGIEGTSYGPITIENLRKYSNEERIIENVPKDEIAVCSSCEFRYACYDSRIPVPAAHEYKWNHKSECNYNPFICKWKGEEGYKTLEECGIAITTVEYNLESARLAEINEEIWG